MKLCALGYVRTAEAAELAPATRLIGSRLDAMDSGADLTQHHVADASVSRACADHVRHVGGGAAMRRT